LANLGAVPNLWDVKRPRKHAIERPDTINYGPRPTKEEGYLDHSCHIVSYGELCVCACPYHRITPKWLGRFFFFSNWTQEGGHLEISFLDHISVMIDARLFIFWWYDGHIVPLFLLTLSMIFDLCSAP
jgi:hypothetical protein